MPFRTNRIRLIRRIGRIVPLACCLLGLYPHRAPAQLTAPAEQLQQFRRVGTKSILELQQYRTSVSRPIRDASGVGGTATLVNLHPRVNAWMLLQLEWPDGRSGSYHLENHFPDGQQILLDENHLLGLVIATGSKRYRCDLWSGGANGALATAAVSRQVYVPLCEQRLSLRNLTSGHKTSTEWATDFLRDYVPGGDRITTFVREFLKDGAMETSELSAAGDPGVASLRPRPAGAPKPSLVDPQYEGHYLVAKDLGLDLAYDVPNQLLVGRWYPVTGHPGIFVSIIQPQLVAAEIVASQAGLTSPLDPLELAANTIMVAFDLNRYGLAFAMGTEHPRVDWSERVQSGVRDASLPGPDGIGSVAPLVNTGLVNPHFRWRVAATFTGGFKRYHGAFLRGELALKNGGSHYGFIENGVVVSKLQPGLATVLIYTDDRVEFKTWKTEYEADLRVIRHARQNGAPIVEYDEKTGRVRPGDLVRQIYAGNWSGSVDGRYRTLRAGLCHQVGDDSFLVYGFFSTATASAMARVFQAYQCNYAMLGDINALEHTYLALYDETETGVSVQHLDRGMAVLDKVVRGQVVPRFIGYADNRDFFYVYRKENR